VLHRHCIALESNVPAIASENTTRAPSGEGAKKEEWKEKGADREKEEH
jgi:hypothetical protein